MTKSFFGYLLLLLSFGAFAQAKKTDSLFAVLAKNPDDSLTKAFFNLQLGLQAYSASAYDSAIYYIKLADASAKRLKNDTLRIKALNLMGDAYSDKGDNPKGLKLYQQAFTLAQKAGNREMQARIIKNIGVLYVSWQKLPEAKIHYDSALRIAREINNPLLQADCINNLGVVYEISEDYPKAIAHYVQALKYYQEVNKKESIAMVFSNLAIAYKYSGDVKKSIEYNTKALELAREMKDRWKEAATLNNIGSAYLKMNNAALGYEFAGNSVKLSNEIGAMEILQIALETQSEAAFAMGNYQDATLLLRRMVMVKDSFINIESTRQVAELQTKFETAQKEQQIQQQKFELQTKNYQLAGVLSGVVFLALLGYSYYRRQKLQQEKEMNEKMLHQQEEATKAVLNAEESERRRIAAELHDGVGQLMSAARMNLESVVKELENLPGEKLLKLVRVVNLVDEGCKEVRTVSHSMMPNALLKKGLGSALQDFILKIDQQVLKTSLHLESLDERLKPEVESVLYRVIQECVTNAIKHSGASQLDIVLLKDNNNIDVTIEDNGKGFAVEAASNGIGLQNIRARVQYLKGTLDIESAPGRGSFFGIHIPL